MTDLNDFFKLIQTAPKAAKVEEPVLIEEAEPTIVEEEQVEEEIVIEPEYSLNDFYKFISENKKPEEKLDLDKSLLNSFFAFASSLPKKKAPVIVEQEETVHKQDFVIETAYSEAIEPEVDAPLPELEEAVKFEEPLKEFEPEKPVVFETPVVVEEKPYIVGVSVEANKLVFEFSNGKKVKLIPPLNMKDVPHAAYYYNAGGGGENEYNSPVPFTTTFSVSPSEAMIGQVLETLTFSYEAGPSVVSSAKIDNGIGEIFQSPTVVNDLNITEDISFVITVRSKKSETASATATVKFKNNVFVGVSPNEILTENEVKTLNATLSEERQRSLLYDCSGGNYFVYAYPSRFGDIGFTQVNGLPWNDWVVQTMNITNEFGYTEEYKVYRSFNKLFGSSIPVNWG